MSNTEHDFFSLLQQNDFFGELSPVEMSELVLLLDVITLKKNQLLDLSKNNKETIFYLHEGLLKISNYENKQETAIELLNKGDLFGEIHVTKSAYETKEIIKVLSDQAIIYKITKQLFEKIIIANPSICLRYAQKIGDRYKSIYDRYKNLILKDVKTRLHEFLFEYATRNGFRSNNELVVKNMLTHQDISELLGCQRQTISILISELKTEYKIIYTRDEIVIPYPIKIAETPELVKH